MTTPPIPLRCQMPGCDAFGVPYCVWHREFLEEQEYASE
jgi:hypothetical protein